jgi:hypothetical protein
MLHFVFVAFCQSSQKVMLADSMKPAEAILCEVLPVILCLVICCPLFPAGSDVRH